VVGSNLSWYICSAGFPQSLQATDWVVHELCHCCFLPNPFQFISLTLPPDTAYPVAYIRKTTPKLFTKGTWSRPQWYSDGLDKESLLHKGNLFLQIPTTYQMIVPQVLLTTISQQANLNINKKSLNVRYEWRILSYIAILINMTTYRFRDRCDIVVRVRGYISRGPGTIPGATIFSGK
jgi:hypothetical protein